MTIEVLAVALQSIPGVGDSAVQSVLRGLAIHGLVPEHLIGMDAARIEELFGLPQSQSRRIACELRTAGEAAGELVRRLHLAGVAIMTARDAAYPQRLAAAMEHPPAVICCHGDAALLRRPLVALANSNKAPRHARDEAMAALGTAIECGLTVVTGHNRPEYQDAALAAYRRGAPCCYVLDRGILCIPAAIAGAGLFPGARVWRDPARPGRDLVLSGCAPAMPAVAGSNRRRDDIVMALASVVVTTHVRSGGTMERLVAACSSRGIRVMWVGSEPPPSSLVHECPTLTTLSSASSLKEQLGDWRDDEGPSGGGHDVTRPARTRM